MPLSKKRQAQWMRNYRKSVIPKAPVIPNQASVIPKSGSVIPNWVAHPNRYLSAHLRVCSDYDPVKPSDHFEHCPYINPVKPSEPVIPKSIVVQPKSVKSGAVIPKIISRLKPAPKPTRPVIFKPPTFDELKKRYDVRNLSKGIHKKPVPKWLEKS